MPASQAGRNEGGHGKPFIRETQLTGVDNKDLSYLPKTCPWYLSANPPFIYIHIYIYIFDFRETEEGGERERERERERETWICCPTY